MIRTGAKQNDVALFERIANLFKICGHIRGADFVTVRLVAEIHQNTVADAPFQRHLVDGPGTLPVVHGGVVVVRRVQVGAGMGSQADIFNGPAVALREIVHGDTAVEIGGHDLRRVLVAEILNMRDLGRGIAGQAVLNGDREVDDFHNKSSFSFFPL